jgi:ribonuclease P protein subunit RPR2
MVFVLICANHFNSILNIISYISREDILSRGKRPKWMIDIAIERMDILFTRAEMEFITHPERSNRYVELALKLSTKYNIPIPEKWARRYCRGCKSFLQPGRNCTVRLVDSEVNIFCGECGHAAKIPYRREKKLKRRAKYESRKKGTDE